MIPGIRETWRNDRTDFCLRLIDILPSCCSVVIVVTLVLRLGAAKCQGHFSWPILDQSRTSYNSLFFLVQIVGCGWASGEDTTLSSLVLQLSHGASARGRLPCYCFL